MRKSRLSTGMLSRTSFQGGMLYDVSDDVAPLSGVRFADNVLPFPLGAVTRRDGRQRKYNSGAVGTVFYDIFRWLGADGTYRDVIYYLDTSAKYATWTAGGAANVTSGLTTNTRAIGMQSNGRMYLNNGANASRVYVYSGGVTSRAVGVGTGPGFSLSQSTGAGALTLLATYSYAMTVIYANGEGETNIGNTSAITLTTTNNQVGLSWTAITPPAGMTVSAYRIWRKLTSGTAWDTYYLVGQTASTTFTDQLADTVVYAAGGGTKVEDNHNGPPTKLTGMVWWDYENRAVAWGELNTVGSDVFPQRLWLSDRGGAEVWRTVQDTYKPLNVAEYIDVPQDDEGNPIIAVVPVRERLYIFNRYGVRIAFSNSSGAYQVTVAVNSQNHGIVGPKAVAVADTGEVYYLSTEGLRRIRGNVDLGVSTNADGSSAVVSSQGADREGQAIASIVGGIPAGMRKHVSMSVYRDLLHIAMATSTVSGTTPTINNDVLIYDLKTNGFYYSSSRNVNGWCIQNDSGNPYRIVSTASDGGMAYVEYVEGVDTDEDPAGVTTPITWKVQDFSRPFMGLDVGVLHSFVIDANAKNGVINALFELDGGRQSSSLQFTYTTGGYRYWYGSSYIETPAALTCTNLTIWRAVTNGSFAFKPGVGVFTFNATGCDFSACTTMEDVASVLNTRLYATGWSDGGFLFINAAGVFRFRNAVSYTSDWTGSTLTSTGSGTDVSGATADSSGVTRFIGGVGTIAPIVTTPTPTLYWLPNPNHDIFVGPPTPGAPTVATPTDVTWSDLRPFGNRPDYGTFNGDRGQKCRITLTGTNAATIYAYRLGSRELPYSSQGT